MKRRIVPLLLLTAVIAGCGAAAYADRYEAPAAADGFMYAGTGKEDKKMAPAKPVPARDWHGKLEQEEGEKGTPSNAGEKDAFSRKIVYTGRFVVDVYDIEKSRTAVVAWAESLGGYMQSQQSGVVVLKVPAKNFPEVLAKLRELGRVNDELTDIRAQDITQEYYDLELRLKTRKEYLASLSKLLEQAGKLEEKLAVQREIAAVVADIEQMEGRMRVMVHMVAFATVTVEFRPAYKGPSRTFRLPWDWLDYLGVEYLVN